MKKSIVTAISVLCLIPILLFTFTACSSSNKLSGKYVSESGKYSVEFNKDGTCRWFEKVFDSESFFDGTYEKSGEVYKLYMKGDGILAFNTTFTAEPVEGGLKITGGSVSGEIFSKK